jgi:hypothetical protein
MLYVSHAASTATAVSQEDTQHPATVMQAEIQHRRRPANKLPWLTWERCCNLFPALSCKHRALKTKHETPKYGLIYHASLIGQSQPKFKGKISRVLAAKCALAIRVDALGDTTDAAVGTEARAKVSPQTFA